MTNRSVRRRPQPAIITLTQPIRPDHHPRGRDRELWTLRRSLRVYVLAVQAAAIITTVVLLSTQQITMHDLTMLAGITALGILKEELTRHIERMRRRYSDTPHQNMTSVWTFAAALVLPAGLAAVAVALLYTHLWFRIWRTVSSVRPWKVVFSASAVTLSCHAATAIQQLIGRQALTEATAWQTVALLVAAIVLYSVVNLGLVSGAIAQLTTERSTRRLFGTLGDLQLEYATLAMGAMAAIILLRSPWVVIFMMPVLLVLHRSVLIRQLEDAMSTDAKTGLLNATTWHRLARSEFERATRHGTEFGVLMLDLDHSQRITDTHGHVVGDRVLKAVADRLTAEMRAYDLLGRFKGEEFVAFCPELTADDLTKLGERLRRAVEQLAVPVDETGDRTVHPTISVGAAHYPESGADLEEVMLAADTALFAAKDSGRNRVQVLRPHLHRQAGQGSSGAPSSSA
jgi:diguanylate cyclase (GGDEF)-like protein